MKGLKYIYLTVVLTWLGAFTGIIIFILYSWFINPNIEFLKFPFNFFFVMYLMLGCFFILWLNGKRLKGEKVN